MCPKKSGRMIYGKKFEQHVPDKERTKDSREEDGGTCARKGANEGFSGGRWGNMCTKKS